MNKKVAVISLSTPTFNNVRAASALPYHLIKGNREMGKSRQLEFEIFSFNINNIDEGRIHKIESELNVKIHLLSHPKWLKWMFKLKLSFLRIFFKYPVFTYYKLPQDIIKNIMEKSPIGIWIYGEELMKLTKFFSNVPVLVTMPDCESLYYYRLLSKRFATQRRLQVLRYSFAYNQYRTMERDFFQNNTLYHFVGKEDSLFFKQINPSANAYFIRHPLYEYKVRAKKGVHTPKIRLLIAGRNNIYMHEASDELVDELCKASTLEMRLYNFYSFTFLGRDWDDYANKLKLHGYDVKIVKFAPDYITELQHHDIQITPISVGTGTKGKVLDAICNGLLVIGTPGALENIAVRNGESCIEYHTASECINYLKDILNRNEFYEEMTQRGMKHVCVEHNRKSIASKLFFYFFNNN